MFICYIMLRGKFQYYWALAVFNGDLLVSVGHLVWPTTTWSSICVLASFFTDWLKFDIRANEHSAASFTTVSEQTIDLCLLKHSWCTPCVRIWWLPYFIYHTELGTYEACYFRPTLWTLAAYCWMWHDLASVICLGNCSSQYNTFSEG